MVAGAAVAVLGSGNVGHAMAGHLALQGHRVQLYSKFESELEPIRRQRGIRMEGEVEGNALPILLTTDLGEAISGAELLMVTAPAFAHRDISEQVAAAATPGQVVVFQPATFGSALELLRVLETAGKQPLLAAETETSLYTCRLIEPGRVFVGVIKRSVDFAAAPAAETARAGALLQRYWPGRYTAGSSVLSAGLNNLNPVYHCPPSLLNFSSVEKGVDQAFHELVTPSVARVIQAVDDERLALGAALGVRVRSFREFLKKSYGATGGDLVEVIHQAYGPPAFRAPRSPQDRYLTEDIPFGLVPWESVSRELGLPAPITGLLIEVANALYGRDLRADGRTALSLGLTGLSAGQIRARVGLTVAAPA